MAGRMPELPDIQLYVERIAAKTVGQPLTTVRLASPFLVRSFDPALKETFGKRVLAVERMAKRVVFVLEADLFVVVHLMIAGRFRWTPPGTKIPGKLGQAAFDFPTGTLLLTEAGSKRRASLYVVRGRPALAALDPGGIDVLTHSLADFTAALVAERHTLKRSLTDPHIYSGIGNAYSDEILHRAKLSPLRHSTQLDDGEIARLYDAIKSTMNDWVARLRAEIGDGFPEPKTVTAFRPEFAVHGKYKQPCPVCKTPVQRIRYAENEANYCPHCQTEDKLLADRALSRLLKGDWPKSLEALDEYKAARKE